MAGYPVIDPAGVDIYDEEGNLTHYDLGDTVPLSKLISRRYSWLVNRGYLSEVETDDWGSTVWGEISGTLSSQTDLQSALDAKLNLTGGTLTGLLTITSGANTFGFKNGGSSVTPQFHLGTSGGKSVGLLAGTTETAFIYDSTGTFNITTDTKANIDAGTSSGGTVRLTMSSTGAMTLTSDLTLSLGNLTISAGYVSLGSVLGDRLMMYGAKDGASSYGLGVEAGALYYRANGTHRWYTGTVADSGTSAVMSLTSTGLTLTGQTYIKNSTPTSLNAIKGSRFGYSTGYRTVVIGDTGTANSTSVAIAEDVSDIVSGSFTGNGSEVIFRNAAKFMTPNSGRTGFIQALKWDSVGKTTLLALDVTTGDASGNLLKVFGDGATNGMAISTNWNTGNSFLDFRIGGTTAATYNVLRLNNGGIVQMPGTTDSTTTTTGTLQVAGGVGIAKKLYVGSDLSVAGQKLLLTHGNPYVSMHSTHTAPGNRYFTGLYNNASGGELRLHADGEAMALYVSNSASYPFRIYSSSWNGTSYDITERFKVDGSNGTATISGNLTVTGTTVSHSVTGSATHNIIGTQYITTNLTCGAGYTAGITFNTGAAGAGQRWIIFKDESAESGANAGSNFMIRNYSDAGAYISTPLTITRSTGAVSLTGNLSVSKASAAMQLNSTSGDAQFFIDRTGAGYGTVVIRSGTSNRWTLGTLGGTETGSDASTNFLIGRHSDAGTYLGAALTITRSTGDIVLASTTDSSSSTTGAIKTAGGMGIAKKLYVGTDLNVAGTIESSDVRAISQVMGVF
jgi:hypothetical protein